MNALVAVLVSCGFASLVSARVPLEKHLVVERVAEKISVSEACKIVRAKEPRGDLTYLSKTVAGPVKVVRPMYSDLCLSPTQQFITKIVYGELLEDRDPVIGMYGENEDDDSLAFMMFSSFVLR